MMAIIKLAFCKEVASRALIIGLIVGTILALINHGDVIFNNEITFSIFIKILITYFVPYGVSTFSSVQAIRARENKAIFYD